MSISPSSFLEIAEEIAGNGNEIYCRTAINRAYYFVLHGAQAVTPRDCFPQENLAMGSHERVIRAVEKLGNSVRPGRTAARELARALRRLRDARRLADYHLDIDGMDKAYALDVIQRARAGAKNCSDIARQAASPSQSG